MDRVVLIDFCNTACFGLHALSKDKEWSTWGRYWVDDWVKEDPDPNQKGKIGRTMLMSAMKAGTSFRRYEVIRRMANLKWPEEYSQALPDQENLPKDESERERIQEEYCHNILGLKGLDDYNVSTCAHCALICGPSLTETSRRYRMLIESGIVVPGPGGKMTRVDSYEEALAMLEKHPYKLGFFERYWDRFLTIFQFAVLYGGFNLKSVIQGIRYERALKKARAHSEEAGSVLKNGQKIVKSAESVPN